MIILDDIERLIDYIEIGPRFSQVVLNTLLVLIKQQPPDNKKLMIIGTTANRHCLEDLSLVDIFNVKMKVPLVHSDEDLKSVLSEFDVDQNELEIIT